MAVHSSTFRFASKASHPKNAVALIYDLEGFSRFFNQPDVQTYVPAFLNHVSEAIAVCLYGGNGYWTGSKEEFGKLRLRVVHEKFMGDGALYIILPPTDVDDFPKTTLRALSVRLWSLQKHFEEVIKKSLHDVPVLEVPKRIRFGASRGSVYELKKSGTAHREFIGFCINQASRLQSYCPDLGFIASARLQIPDDELQKSGYMKIVATKIKGFPNEIVIVKQAEYNALSAETKSDLFFDQQA